MYICVCVCRLRWPGAQPSATPSPVCEKNIEKYKFIKNHRNLYKCSIL